MSISIFGFRALWSPYFFLFIMLLTVVYFLLVRKISKTTSLKTSQKLLFITSMVLIYLVKGGPLDLMGHLMFYAHMVQMAFLLFIIPPIFIISIPDWVWKGIRVNSHIHTLFSLLTKPLVSLIFFNTAFSLYHIPIIFDVIKTNMILHESYTILLFILAMCMWWPLMNKVDEYQSLTGLKKVAYIFASSALILPACALIIFNDKPMYTTYSDPKAWAKSLELCVPISTLDSLELSGPEMFSSMSLIHDQQLGGILMKVIQEIVYGIILAIVFFEWYRQDNQESEYNHNFPSK